MVKSMLPALPVPKLVALMALLKASETVLGTLLLAFNFTLLTLPLASTATVSVTSQLPQSAFFARTAFHAS